MFRTVPLSIIRRFSLYTQQRYMPYILRAGSGRSVLILLASCQQTCMTYTIAVFTVKETADDGQRNCPKHVEFYSKNKFEKLVHLVGFIIGISETGRLHSCCGHETENTVLLWNHQTSYNKELLGKFGADDYVAESTTDNALRSC